MKHVFVSLLCSLCWLVSSTPAFAGVRIGVFGLFHPRALIVGSAGAAGITLLGNHETCVLRGDETARVRLVNGSVQTTCDGRLLSMSVLRVTSRIGGVADIEVTVPGKLTRTFRGVVEVTAAGGELVPVVSMDLETAVASVVAAEQASSTPIEALKAQAVAARSYFAAASGRHHEFDFCDTTHCQFLREPPARDDPAERAARQTAGLVLTFRGAPIAALYSASCGGRTRSLAQAGLSARDGYPYYGVECSYCSRHGKEWESRLTAHPDVERLAIERSEGARLAIGRRNGWSVVPGNNFEVSREQDEIVLHGRGLGHGIGLCQLGAASMAKERQATFPDILNHYYPGTLLLPLPSGR
jgi:stage II sporulation protein D (peptidoglycan lytic transglycosylase)